MTDPRATARSVGRLELRRQLRFVRRNTDLIGNLVRIRAGLPIDPKAASAAAANGCAPDISTR